MSMRILSAVAVLVIVGVFFALPLYAAMTACTMPCCHPHRATQTAVVGNMPPCTSTICITVGDETTAAATRALTTPNAPLLPAPVVATTITAVQAPPAFHISLDSGPPSSDAPLHLLNSVFRI